MEPAQLTEGAAASPAQPPILRVGKDELNLAEFPITLLADRVPKGQTTIEYHDRIYDERAGREITRKLTITAAEKYGLPTATDDDVILALIQLAKQANGFTDREVKFTRLELINLLGWPDSGFSYKRILTSFRRWTSVYLDYECAWWDKQQQAWTTRGFHIIDNFELNDSRVQDGQQELFLSRVAWNKVVFESFQAGYLKSLDYELYMKLAHPTAKRMFRFLDKRFYHRPDWTFDLHDLAFEHVGLSRSYSGNAGKIKEKLQPAIEELEAIGFLEPMGRGERYAKVGRGEWKVALARRRLAEVAQNGQKSAGARQLEEALSARGVTRTTAAELVATLPADHIQARIEAFDWLAEKKDKRVSKSPGGYLADSIRKGYTAPKGFESKADREKRLQAEAEKRQKAEEAKRRAEADEHARQEAEQARIRAYFDSLSPEEQERLRADALANANSFFMQQYRRNQNDPAISARYLKLIMDTHISDLLASQEVRTGTDG